MGGRSWSRVCLHSIRTSPAASNCCMQSTDQPHAPEMRAAEMLAIAFNVCCVCVDQKGARMQKMLSLAGQAVAADAGAVTGVLRRLTCQQSALSPGWLASCDWPARDQTHAGLRCQATAPAVAGGISTQVMRRVVVCGPGVASALCARSFLGCQGVQVQAGPASVTRPHQPARTTDCCSFAGSSKLAPASLFAA